MVENNGETVGQIKRKINKNEKKINIPVTRSETIQVECARKTRGRPKLTWVEVVKRDMAACNLTADKALNRAEWRNRIHVADPK